VSKNEPVYYGKAFSFLEDLSQQGVFAFVWSPEPIRTMSLNLVTGWRIGLSRRNCGSAETGQLSSDRRTTEAPFERNDESRGVQVDNDKL